MPNSIKKIALKDLLAVKGRQGVSLRRRLMLYLLSLILTGVGLLLLILFMSGVLSGNESSRIFQVHLENTSNKLEERVGFMAGSGLELSKSIAKSIEKELDYPYDIKSITNNKGAILEVEKAIYPILEKYLDVVRVSGSFAILDTTVNDSVSNAKTSRSGLHIHLGNVSSVSSFDKDVYLFRGMSEIARENHIRMHNRWTMEMDIGQMDWYERQLGTSSKQYVLTKKYKLGRTWEDVVYLSVPIEGSNGQSYGVCGLEMSSLLFRLSYPTISGEYKEMVTVMAPMDGDRFFVKDGLVGKESTLSKQETLTVKYGKHYNTYVGGDTDYIGVHSDLQNVYTEDGQAWKVLILASEADVLQYLQSKQRIVVLQIVFFILIMFAISMFLSKHYVKPIVDSIEKIKNNSDGTPTGISELDALSEFMKSKADQVGQNPNDLPPNIKVLFDHFIERSRKLTEAERGILHYYIQGYAISEIPNLAFISLNTVRKHNRSIYEKLEIGSIDELKLYIDFLRRLDMLHEIR